MAEYDYTSNFSNEFLRWELIHKNSTDDIVRVDRVFRDKWQPGVAPDVVYTQIYEQLDAMGAVDAGANTVVKIVKVYPYTRTAP